MTGSVRKRRLNPVVPLMYLPEKGSYIGRSSGLALTVCLRLPIPLSRPSWTRNRIHEVPRVTWA